MTAYTYSGFYAIGKAPFLLHAFLMLLKYPEILFFKACGSAMYLNMKKLNSIKRDSGSHKSP